MENCFVYKDNIQDQAYKTWFEPIKSVELSIMHYTFKFLVNFFMNAIKNIT
jgi:hypothetical protein